MKHYNLFLDDFRMPPDAWAYTKDQDYLKLDWVIVRSFDEFTTAISEGFSKEAWWPSLISFDHDLSDDHYNHLTAGIPYESFKEETGYHCAQWLIEYCMDRDLKLPDFKVHSMNPAGRANIQSILEQFTRHQSRA